MKYRNPDTGDFEDIFFKVADTLPIGSEVEYNGDVVPYGWEEVVDDDVFSTTEIKTNKVWINGKPLYQKTFSGDLTLGSITEIADISDLNYEYVSFYDVSFFKTNTSSSSGSFWFPVFYDSSSDYARVYVRNRDQKLLGLVKGDPVTELKVYVTLRYTKTTD